MRLWAKLAPIMPKPMKPTRGFWLFIIKYFRGNPTRVHSGWPTCIKSEVCDQAAQFVFGYTVIQRAAHVTTKLVSPIQSRQHGHRD